MLYVKFPTIKIFIKMGNAWGFHNLSRPDYIMIFFNKVNNFKNLKEQKCETRIWECFPVKDSWHTKTLSWISNYIASGLLRNFKLLIAFQ